MRFHWMYDSAASSKVVSTCDHDVFIHIKEDNTYDVYCRIDQHIKEAQLLGLGIGWCLESEDWRKRVTKRAYAKVKGMIDGE